MGILQRSHFTPLSTEPNGEVERAGSARTELAVSGMTCNGCAQQVTQAILKVGGVASALVSLPDEHASVRWAPGVEANARAVLEAVRAAGYEARQEATGRDEMPTEAQARQWIWSLNVWLGIIPTGLLLAGDWILGLGDATWYRWVSFVLAAMVQFGPGRHFYQGAWRQLKVGSSNMDTLVVLGSTTAFVYSAWALLAGTAAHLYFLEAAAIITLVSLGHWMEARATALASSSLKALMNLAPLVARRRNADGFTIEVPVEELRLNDEVLLKPGDRVPTDGEVIDGGSAVDESMLTGESLSIEKTAGAKLYAGTVNLNGQMTMRVTSLGEDTALAQIIAAVERAQNSRANIQRIGDRVSSVFVPTVVLVALAAALWWGLLPQEAQRVTAWLGQYLWAPHVPASALAAAVRAAAAVLIVACPCAMGLATPAAIMAGSNVAARRGILIRDGVALEKAGIVTAVLFDKTGTLTVGQPEVVQAEAFTPDGLPAKEQLQSLLELAAALANPSAHPLSRAVSKLARGTRTLRDWKEVSGAGVQAREDHKTLLRLGSLKWLADSGVDVRRPFVDQWTSQGATVLGLCREQSLVLLLALKDTVKPGAAEVVQRLEGEGLAVYLVTGDHSRSAASLARQIGLGAEHVFSEIPPDRKAELVKKLQQRGECVAFVGDGINDAPALEQADLGIAVSRASDIAREAADIILLRSEIDAVPESIGLARATLRTIKQNLFWAFFYNALGVPLAALGFMSPILCAAAMGLSDLIVIGNALRLRRWRPRHRLATE